MTDQGITLNIHNKPPQIADETNNNINETEVNINQTLDLPNRSQVENIQSQNNNERNIGPIQIQQNPQQIGYPPQPAQIIPVGNPMAQQNNPIYGQPVINQPNAYVQQPTKVIVQKEEKSTAHRVACCGFIAGCIAAATACCLYCLLCGCGKNDDWRW